MTLLGLLLLASSVAARGWDLPRNYHQFAPRAEGFNWEPCPDNPLNDCSWFEVPLDWANESVGKARLAVARYKAAVAPKLGTIFMNPGGPGGSGVDMIVGGGPLLSEMTGGQYDLVSWDPRGVGKSLPRANCFGTASDERLFWNGTIPDTGFEARGNFTDQQDVDAFYSQVDEVDGLLKKLGQICLKYTPNLWQYIGSVAAVRDMIAMHDILEGPSKPINFWGMSYGTVIGIYFVNMFPDRVGRVVLDGVVDPVYWANLPPHQIWGIAVESSDEAFTGFVTACAAAGPSGCAIASTVEVIRKFVNDLIDLAYNYRRAGGEVGSSYIRNLIFQGMYTPSKWPQLATDLLSLYQQLAAFSTQGTPQPTKRSLRKPILDAAQRKTRRAGDAAPDYSFQGVTCADAIDAGTTTTKDVFDYLVNVTRTVSPMFGPLWGIGGFYCHHWPARAVERYTGPWNNKLSNPILVIGNEADPVTPYISAKRVADALGDSAILIEQDDYGHVSLAMKSDCTAIALHNYFMNNVLPTEDKVCGTNQVLFPGPGITKSVLAKISSGDNSTATTTDFSTIHDELSKAVQRSQNLFMVVIALAVATGLLLLGVIFSCIHNRRRSKARPMHPVFIPRGMDEKTHDEQGHTYDDPFKHGPGAKSGGYSRVES